MKYISISCLFIFSIVNTVFSQVYDPVKWKFFTVSQTDQQTELHFVAEIEKNWHMYGLNIPAGGPVATSFSFNDETNINFLGGIRVNTNPEIKYDSTFEMNVELFSNRVEFIRKVKSDKTNLIEIKGTIEFMACDDSRCLPPKEVEFVFEIKPDVKSLSQKDNVNDTLNVIPDTLSAVNSENPTITEVHEITQSNLPLKNEKSLWALFFAALLAGFGALLTPCVYPIIPLTVSYFIRNESRSKALIQAIIFGLSIIIIYTLVGLIAGLFKVDLVRLISSYWLPNLLFFVLFIALAASFFGMFEISLPSSLSTKIDMQADKGGFFGPFFMALATVVISFSCTGPLVGVTLGSALQGDLIRPVVGMLGFSITFAMPFTLLAMFPNILKKLPKSGGWLNSIKVFFAFIMLLFSLIFLGNLQLEFLNREVILSLALVITTLLGFYLLGKIKFAHDSEISHVSFPRILLVIVVFSLSIYLLTGIFGAPLKPVAPFLPPQENSIFFQTGGVNQQIKLEENKFSEVNICVDKPKYAENTKLHIPLGLKGYFDYDEALACAAKLNKPILLDFAGHGCKNCKKMYAEVWSDPAVLKKLQTDFVIAVLYTDDNTELPPTDWVTSVLDGKVKKRLGKKFNDLQITKFGSNALPLYAIVDTKGNILTTEKFYTYSSEIPAFLNFLNEGLENFK